MSNVSKAVDYLNGLILADEKAMNEIFHFRTPCNDDLADLPLVQTENNTISALGIINGLFGSNAEGTGKIKSHFSETGKLMCFSSNEKSKRLDLVDDGTAPRVQVFDTIHLQNKTFDSLALDLLDKDFCIKNTLIPVEFNTLAATLTVAMANPLDLRAIDDMKFYTGFNIAPRSASVFEINRAIVLNYERGHVNDAVATENAACMKIAKDAVVKIASRLADREVVEVQYRASEEKLINAQGVKEIREEAIRDCIKAIAQAREEWNENNFSTHVDLAIQTLHQLLDRRYMGHHGE